MCPLVEKLRSPVVEVTTISIKKVDCHLREAPGVPLADQGLVYVSSDQHDEPFTDEELPELVSDLQEDVQKLKEDIVEVKEKKGASKPKSQKDGANAKKKLLTVTGLVGDWKMARTRKSKQLSKSIHHDSPVLGGLDDKDVDSTRPEEYPQSPNLPWIHKAPSTKIPRDKNRKNEEIQVISGSEVEDKSMTVKMVTCKSTNKSRKIEKASDSTASGSNKVLDTRNVRFTDLPAFARDKWESHFLLTLYEALYMSKNPFGDFTHEKTSKLLEIVSAIAKKVWPNSNYVIQKDNAFYLLSFNRLNEKKSGFAKAGLEGIQKYIEGEFGDDTSTIGRWVQWALRPDGPLYFKKPTPLDCSIDRKHKDYIISHG
ncbi:hypothetical protein C8J56DRAFT_1042931 [Mycena floridula]|nr:hypothetical protein C8J56DRAFT_1042931 [Mycena floridula]